jgi:PAS domain S-box-containing protein
LSWVVHEIADRDEAARVRRALARVTDWRANDLHHKLLKASEIVAGAAAFIGATPDPTPDSFRAFLKRHGTGGEVARTVQWTPWVKDADRPAFEAAASRMHGRPVAIVHPGGGEGAAARWVPAERRGDYLPILFYVDFAEVLPATAGVDHFVQPARRGTAMRAARTGESLATPAVPLMGSAEAGAGFIVYAPVYSSGPLPATAEERLARLRGFATGSFAVVSLLQWAIKGTPAPVAPIRVFLGADNDPQAAREVAAYDRNAGQFRPILGGGGLPGPAPGRVIHGFEMLGQRWTLVWDFPPSAMAELRSASPWLWLAAGLLLTALMAGLLAAKQRQMSIVEATVLHRTRDLAAANEALRREAEMRAENQRKLDAAQFVNRRIFETSVDLILVVGRKGDFTQVSPSAFAILGYRPEEMAGRNGIEFIHPDDIEAVRNQLREGRRTGMPRRFHCRYRHKDGRMVTLAWTGIWSEPEQRHYFTGRDMTDRLEMEDKLREANEMFAAIIETSPFAIICVDANRTVLAWNRAAEAIFGYTAQETVGQPYKLIPSGGEAEFERYFRRVLDGEMLRNIEVMRRRKDGALRRISFSGAPLFDPDGKFRCVVYALQDITDRNVLEQQLRQAQKLEAVGQLSGGLAHDFNNLLGVIIGNLDLAVERLGDDSKARELVEAALNGALRGGQLVKQLLAVSRRQPLAPAVIDLNAGLREIAPLLKRTLGDDVAVELRLAADLRPVLADPALVESAVLNLAVNARDAMPKGGTLTIETANRHLDTDYAAIHAEVAVGDYAMIAISDTGTGMPPDVVARAFEPFFTTKETGKGTGLGLAMVYGFVKQSGGHANIYSEVGHGTTIRLYFPAAKAAVAAKAKEAAAEKNLPMGNETVLVVEDREDLRAAAVAMLQRLGYRTLEAETAAAALAMLRDGARVDLVFTDVLMPGGMSGLDLVHEMRLLGIKLPVLVTSGYASPHVLREQAQKLGLPTLAKPYRIADLAENLRETLDKRT